MWTTAQERYFVALEEWVGDGNLYIQKNIAELAGIEHTRISKWNRDPAFRAEVGRRLREVIVMPVERAHQGMLRAGERGNVLAYNAAMTTLERHGRIAVVAGSVDPTGQVVNGVQVHVHGIPERAPFASLPPPMDATGRVLSAPTSAPAK